MHDAVILARRCQAAHSPARKGSAVASQPDGTKRSSTWENRQNALRGDLERNKKRRENEPSKPTLLWNRNRHRLRLCVRLPAGEACHESDDEIVPAQRTLIGAWGRHLAGAVFRVGRRSGSGSPGFPAHLQRIELGDMLPASSSAVERGPSSRTLTASEEAAEVEGRAGCAQSNPAAAGRHIR